MELDNIQSIIIDNGGDTIKAGFNLDCFPCTVFPNVRGGSRDTSPISQGRKYNYVGNEALEGEKFLTLAYPIENGVITNWDAMEAVWHHTLYDTLRIPPEEHPILLTEMPLTPKANREKMTQIMFETFNTPAIYPCSSSLLSLYGSGRTTGVVLETGHTFSVTVPICKGYSLSHAILRQELSGSQLTDFLTKSLFDRQLYSSSSQRDIKMIRHIKETFFFCKST